MVQERATLFLFFKLFKVMMDLPNVGQHGWAEAGFTRAHETYSVENKHVLALKFRGPSHSRQDVMYTLEEFIEDEVNKGVMAPGAVVSVSWAPQ